MKRLLIALFFAGLVGAQEDLFHKPAEYIGPVTSDKAIDTRSFQGIASVAVSRGGRLWADWYAGPTPGEDRNNYIVLSTSGDNGQTWKEVLIVDPDGSGPVRAFDPELWLAPDGKLYVFWAQSIGHKCTVGGVWYLVIENPDDDTPVYGKPVRIADGVMMCKPIVLTSGEWALPNSTWRETDYSAKMTVSADGGKTWTLRGAANNPAVVERSFDEHMIVERKDGSLWMLVRTNYGIGESVSSDRGKTWTDVTRSTIPHTSSRFFITRLASGRLLLIKHGKIDEKTGRSHLRAMLSDDDGKTWTGELLLDERAGISYPDAQQLPDGLVRMIYDYNRVTDKEILSACFREEDIRAGKIVSPGSFLRQRVSKAFMTPEQAARVYPAVNPNADGAAPDKSNPGTLGGYAVQPFEPSQTLFTDRQYQLDNVPDFFSGAKFLRTPLAGKKTVECVKPGIVFVLTPARARNKDSAVEELVKQGFAKVALKEIRLFNPLNRGNFVTVYAKICGTGETITFGQWAVPVFFGN